MSSLDEIEPLLINASPGNEAIESLPREGTSSLFGSIANLSTSIIGGGTLSFAFIFHLAGLVLGALLMVVIGFLSVMAAYLLVESGELGGRRGYKGLAAHIFGRMGGKAMELIIVVYTFGAMSAYLVIIASSLQSTVKWAWGSFIPLQNWWQVDFRFLLACYMPVICGLSMLKTMSALKFTSVGSLASTLYIIVIVVVRSIQHGLDFSKVVFFRFSLELLWASALLVLSFIFHFNVETVQAEMRNPTKPRIVGASSASIGVAVLLYLVMGFFGYLRFGDKVESNILDSFVSTDGDVLIDVGKIAFLLVLTFAFPLLIHPCRYNLASLINKPTLPNWLHVSITILLCVGAYGVAATGAPIGLIFGVFGGSFGVFLVLVAPGVFYLKSTSEWSAMRVYALVSTLLGGLLIPACLFGVIYFSE